jgi:trans-aconitate methyltransferase
MIMDLLTWLMLGFSLLLLGLATGAWSAAPWVPTRQCDWSTIAELLDLQPNQLFYEVGCGHGHLLAYLAQKYPQSQLVGLEISPLLALAAAWKTRHLPNVQIRWTNLWHYSLTNADALYFFLLPKVYPRLVKMLKNQLRPETKIVFGDWPLKDRIPHRELRPAGSVPYYLYLASEL